MVESMHRKRVGGRGKSVSATLTAQGGRNGKTASRARHGRVPNVSAAKAGPKDAALVFESAVLRVGSLVSAYKSAQAHQRLRFTYRIAEPAEKILDKMAAHFLARLQGAAQAAIRTKHIDAVAPFAFPEPEALAPAQRGLSVGMVYDFAEFAILWRGVLVLVRACLTLCTQAEHATNSSPGTSEAYSKFWIRFFVPPSAGIKQVQYSSKFTATDMSGFYLDMKHIGEAMLASMELPYQSLLRELDDKHPNLTVTRTDQFNVFAAASTRDDFAEFYSEVCAGKRLKDLLEFESAKDLVKVEMRLVGNRADGDMEDFLSSQADSTNFYNYETPRFYRGLFFRKRLSEHEALFFGLTDALELPTDGDPMFNAKMAAPNAVTTTIINEVGALF